MCTNLVKRPEPWILLALGVVACGSIDTAGHPAPHTVTIEVGRWTKEDVVNALGLPNKTGWRDGANGAREELWTYFSRPDFVSYQVMMPGKGGPMMVPVARVRPPAEGRQDVAAIIVFDASGVVSEARTFEEKP